MVQSDQGINYTDFYQNVLNVAGYFQHAGYTKGSPVMLLADNSIFSACSYLGVMMGGLSVVPLHPQTTPETLHYVMAELKISAVITQKKYLKKFEPFTLVKHTLSDKGPENTDSTALVSVFSQLPRADETVICPMDLKKDIASILFTSGSTGVPKGVILSHQNLFANTNSIIEYLQLDQSDRMMEVLPYSYCYGLSWLHTITKVGGTHILSNRFMFLNKFLGELVEQKCTGFAGVPSHFQMLLRRSKLKEMTFPDLKFVAQAGGKLPDVFIKELHETLPTTTVYIMYGQTEATARLSYLPPKFLDTKLGSIGKGIPGVILEVLKDDGSPAKGDDVGSIVASGEIIMLGYWKDPEETAKVLRNGKLWTGDLARVEEEGFIYVVDREKQIIKSGGHRISPKEIESQILQLPEVVECAVIGVPDDLLGEIPKAYVVLNRTLKNESEQHEYEEKILSQCRQGLPSFKTPRAIAFLDELPKNTANKVLVNLLKEQNTKK